MPVLSSKYQAAFICMQELTFPLHSAEIRYLGYWLTSRARRLSVRMALTGRVGRTDAVLPSAPRRCDGPGRSDGRCSPVCPQALWRAGPVGRTLFSRLPPGHVTDRAGRSDAWSREEAARRNGHGGDRSGQRGTGWSEEMTGCDGKRPFSAYRIIWRRAVWSLCTAHAIAHCTVNWTYDKAMFVVGAEYLQAAIRGNCMSDMVYHHKSNYSIYEKLLMIQN